MSQMKKLLSIAMLLFFMMGQVNLTWAMHYCGDKLMSSEVSLAPEKSDCCGDEGTKSMDCCADEVTVADSDDFFGKTEINLDLSPSFVLALVYSFLNISLTLEEPQRYEIAQKGIPIADLNILYQNFLI